MISAVMSMNAPSFEKMLALRSPPGEKVRSEVWDGKRFGGTGRDSSGLSGWGVANSRVRQGGFLVAPVSHTGADSYDGSMRRDIRVNGTFTPPERLS